MLIYSSTQPKRTGFIHYSDTRTGERRVGFAYMRILVNGQSIRLHVCGFALQRYWNTSVKRSAVTQRFVCHAKDHLNVIICMRVDNVQSSFLDSAPFDEWGEAPVWSECPAPDKNKAPAEEHLSAAARGTLYRPCGASLSERWHRLHWPPEANRKQIVVLSPSSYRREQRAVKPIAVL